MTIHDALITLEIDEHRTPRSPNSSQIVPSHSLALHLLDPLIRGRIQSKMVWERRIMRKIYASRSAEIRKKKRKARMEQATSQPSKDPIQEELQPNQGISGSPPPPPSPVGRMATRAIVMG